MLYAESKDIEKLERNERILCYSMFSMLIAGLWVSLPLHVKLLVWGLFWSVSHFLFLFLSVPRDELPVRIQESFISLACKEAKKIKVYRIGRNSFIVDLCNRSIYPWMYFKTKSAIEVALKMYVSKFIIHKPGELLLELSKTARATEEMKDTKEIILVKPEPQINLEADYPEYEPWEDRLI